MRSLMLLSVGAALVAGSTFVPTPAAAMTGREATTICNRRPECNYVVDSGGGIYIRNGGHWVYCPGMDGECFVVVRQAPPNQTPTSVRGQRVEAIMGVRTRAQGSTGAQTPPRSPGS